MFPVLQEIKGSTSKGWRKGQEEKSEVSSEESLGSKVSSSSEESQAASTDDLRIGTFQYTSDKSKFTVTSLYWSCYIKAMYLYLSICIHPIHAIGYNINRVHIRPVSLYNIVDGTVTKASTFIYLDELNST